MCSKLKGGKELNAKIIAIANQKGGAGKTTTCANLGIGLDMENKEVKRDLRLPMYDALNTVEELKQEWKHPTPKKV